MPIASAPIAVCSWSLRASNSAMLVERVQATGAKAVQLALTPIADWDAAWGDTFARLADAGIEVVSGMLETVGEDYSTLDTIRATGGVVPDATWPATRARAIEVARVAGKNKVRLVTFHAGFIPHEEGAQRDELFARLREIARIFRDHGARIAFETGQESADTLAHALDLLGDDRDRVVAGAVLALEAMGAVGGDDRFWAGIVDVLLDHVAEVAEGTDRWRWLSHLVRLVPTPVLTATGRRVGARLAPAPRVATWSQGRRNQLWADCEAGARRATDALDLAEQPMLARLVFDIVVSPYESHAVTSYMLLSGLPDLATQVCEELAEVAGSHADPAIAERTGRRLAGMLHPVMPTAARAWLADGDARLRESALRMAGCGGLVLPSDVLRAGVAEGGSSQWAALYAAGMTQHPVLEELLAHPDDAVAGAATWWRQRGPRLQEPDAP